jgi:DNA-directed RNA polymerase specialized sigma24 family protein
MDRGAALDRLPEIYANALRLRDAGLRDEDIAMRLGIPQEAVAALLRVAEAKLARLMASDEPLPAEADPDRASTPST